MRHKSYGLKGWCDSCFYLPNGNCAAKAEYASLSIGFFPNQIFEQNDNISVLENFT